MNGKTLSFGYKTGEDNVVQLGFVPSKVVVFDIDGLTECVLYPQDKTNPNGFNTDVAGARVKAAASNGVTLSKGDTQTSCGIIIGPAFSVNDGTVIVEAYFTEAD